MGWLIVCFALLAGGEGVLLFFSYSVVRGDGILLLLGGDNIMKEGHAPLYSWYGLCACMDEEGWRSGWSMSTSMDR